MIDPKITDLEPCNGKNLGKRVLVMVGGGDVKKIGFHAPATRFVCSEKFNKYFKDMSYEKLPKIFNIDKLKNLINKRLNEGNEGKLVDYFLYSILNIYYINNH